MSHLGVGGALEAEVVGGAVDAADARAHDGLAAAVALQWQVLGDLMLDLLRLLRGHSVQLPRGALGPRVWRVGRRCCPSEVVSAAVLDDRSK